MVYRGHVENGTIRLDTEVVLPEGAEVQVAVLSQGDSAAEETEVSLYERLKPLVGAARGLPPDLARNHDHYLHGRAKQ
jgi:hypothetical protein